MSDQPCCSHSKLGRITIQHPGGTQSERWVCPDCLTNFWPEGTDMHKMKRRHDFACAALQGWAAGRNHGEAFANTRNTAPEYVAESCFKYADAMLAEEMKAKPL